MDWQIRLALIILGLILVGYIYFDYNKKKKIQKENERLKRQFSGVNDKIDSAGFDRTGVGSVRLSNSSGSSISDFIEEQSSHENLDIRTEPVLEESASVTKIELGPELEPEPDFTTAIENNIENNLESLNHLSSNIDKNSQQSSLHNGAEDNIVENRSIKETIIKKAVIKETNVEEKNKTISVTKSNAASNVSPRQQEQLVFSFIVQAPAGETFKGNDFLPLFLSQGLRHGDMGIFHRHQKAKIGSKGPGAVLFSLANAIAPGTFSLSGLESFETPALALFMTLPGPADAQVAYNAMLNTARLLQRELSGDLLDETKSKYTEQVHNHRLDQIQEFNRKGFML